jgi:hypothetical protein
MTVTALMTVVVQRGRSSPQAAYDGTQLQIHRCSLVSAAAVHVVFASVLCVCVRVAVVSCGMRKVNAVC